MGIKKKKKGLQDRWAAIRARRDDEFDRDIQAMIDAYQAAHTDPLTKLADAVLDAHKPSPARGTLPQQATPLQPRQRGQFPDGSPVPEAFKQRAYANYTSLRDAYYAG